ASAVLSSEQLAQRKDEIPSSIVVWEMHPPTSKGELDSPLQPLIPYEAYRSRLLMCASEAHARRAHPVVYTEGKTPSPAAAQIQRDYGAPGESEQSHKRHLAKEDEVVLRVHDDHELGMINMRSRHGNPMNTNVTGAPYASSLDPIS